MSPLRILGALAAAILIVGLGVLLVLASQGQRVDRLQPRPDRPPWEYQ